jgi:phosphoserine/homoserine phosphotransferase
MEQMMTHNPMPPLVCSDLEGVLVPEIWIAVAEKTGIDALFMTTRDEPDYDKLMAMRIEILRQHDLRLADVQQVIGTLSPLPGAVEFVAWVRERAQFVILSDTFYEFAAPLMAQMSHPTIFCHNLLVDEAGFVTGWRRRLDQPKRTSIQAFSELGFRTFAMGDSYNDIAMIHRADLAVLFDPPENVVADHPELTVTRTYAAVKQVLQEQFGLS